MDYNLNVQKILLLAEIKSTINNYYYKFVVPIGEVNNNIHSHNHYTHHNNNNNSMSNNISNSNNGNCTGNDNDDGSTLQLLLFSQTYISPKKSTANIRLNSNDGINARIFGIYLDSWLILELKYMICILIDGEFNITTNNTDCLLNGYSITLFLLFSTFFASLNHARHAIYIPYFFDVRDHDVNYQTPRSNYGQFIMFWDHIFGNYHDYFNAKQRKYRENKIADELRGICD